MDEYYVGLWSALNYWGLTENVPRTVFVVTTKRKRDLEYGPTRFEFVTIAKKRFFGSLEARLGDKAFAVSSREKTVVDCLYMPKYCGGLDEVAKALWRGKKDMNFDKLVSLTRRFGVTVVERRLAFMLDLLKIEPGIRSRLVPKRFTGYMWLDPLGPKKRIGYSKKYGLILNRSPDDLTAWMGR
jgi:predicted transcriptional regulator of viral defense system